MSRNEDLPPQLTVTTRYFDAPADLSQLLHPLDEYSALWLREGEGMLAYGVAHKITCTGPERMREAAQRFSEIAALATVHNEVHGRGTGLVAFGSFTYASDSPTESTLLIPSVIIGMNHHTGFLTEITVERGGLVHELAPATAVAPLQTSLADAELRTTPLLDSATWVARTAATVAAIKAGEAQKVVLSRQVNVSLPTPLNPAQVCSALAKRYPATWVFLVDRFMGASPEMLVHRHGEIVRSRCLAGTVARSADPTEDASLLQQLFDSPKDLNEHGFAVNSVVTALEPLCREVEAPARPYVLQLPNVAHLASDVLGKLNPCEPLPTALEIAAALHPSAAVCGTPTEAAEAIITQMEGVDRELYAGPVGWIDAEGDGEWAIALRCGQLSPDGTQMKLYAGCGIVAESDPSAELAETERKMRPMLEALRQA